MASASSVRMLEIEPDLARFLTSEERAAAAPLSLPTRTVPKGAVDMTSLLEETKAFGAFVLEGMVLQRLRVGDQVSLRLLGPGDLLSPSAASRSMLLVDSGYRAAAEVRLALLGNEVLLAAHRWPRIVAGLHVRLSEQSDRLATQLVICQIPRVDQRLLALMWLLAESWGHVTPVGTTLPLSLTHDALGGLIGARRPTVTLAIGELTERGAVVRQDRGWLLLEAPPRPAGLPRTIEEPGLLEMLVPSRASEAEQAQTTSQSRAALREAVGALREEHLRNIERQRERLRQVASSRERCNQVRRSLARQGLSRRRAPSS